MFFYIQALALACEFSFEFKIKRRQSEGRPTRASLIAAASSADTEAQIIPPWYAFSVASKESLLFNLAVFVPSINEMNIRAVIHATGD